jgi:hypothetical protein
MTDIDAEYMARMELRLIREIQAVKETVPSEEKIRELARAEMGLASKAAWSARSTFITVGMFLVAVSTFVLTAFRGSGHGP